MFSVLDSRPNEYITLTTPFTPGSALRYTHHLIPSGTGTRLVTYAVTPTSADSGETVPELSGPDTAEEVLAIMQGPLDRLVEMADDAVGHQPTTNRRGFLVDVPQSPVPEKGGGPR